MTIVVVITYTELLFIEYTELLKKVKTKILLKNGIYYGASNIVLKPVTYEHYDMVKNIGEVLKYYSFPIKE